jgi:hypothetical protein
LKTLTAEKDPVTEAKSAVPQGTLEILMQPLCHRFPDVFLKGCEEVIIPTDDEAKIILKRQLAESIFLIILKQNPLTGALLLLGPRTGKGANLTAQKGGAILNDRLSKLYPGELYTGSQFDRAECGARLADQYFTDLIRHTGEYLGYGQVVRSAMDFDKYPTFQTPLKPIPASLIIPKTQDKP